MLCCITLCVDGLACCPAPSAYPQIGLLLLRSMRVRRFRALSVQVFATQLFVACLSGLFWWQVRFEGFGGFRVIVFGAQGP